MFFGARTPQPMCPGTLRKTSHSALFHFQTSVHLAQTTQTVLWPLLLILSFHPQFTSYSKFHWSQLAQSTQIVFKTRFWLFINACNYERSTKHSEISQHSAGQRCDPHQVQRLHLQGFTRSNCVYGSLWWTEFWVKWRNERAKCEQSRGFWLQFYKCKTVWVCLGSGQCMMGKAMDSTRIGI